jgi:hypothetical protein
MGQANVRRWTDDILPLLLGGDDALGVDTYASITFRSPMRPRLRNIPNKRTARSRSSCSHESDLPEPHTEALTGALQACAAERSRTKYFGPVGGQTYRPRCHRSLP